MNQLTQKELKHHLYYNPLTGTFKWNFSRPGVSLNKRPGSLNSKKYLLIQIDKKRYLAHRLAWLYMKGYFPENEIDHINQIRNDNRWDNLREVTHQKNSTNCKLSSNNTSGITGVTKKKYKNNIYWISRIKIKGKQINLGCFTNKLDAAKSRLEAEKKYNFLIEKSTAYQYIQKLIKE